MFKVTFYVLIIFILFLTITSIAFTDYHLNIENKENKNMDNIKEAVFAGGCFWKIEYVFEEVNGVYKAVSGYSGGSVINPTYKEVSTGKTGHYESVLVKYDSNKVSYERLLEIYWKNVDPLDHEIQKGEYGSQYGTVIFYSNVNEKKLGEESKNRIENSNIYGKPISTKILKRKKFYPAENYHQDYYNKHQIVLSGANNGTRDIVNRLWLRHSYFKLFPEIENYWIGYENPSKSQLKKALNTIQYRITQEDGTEPPFNNDHWNNHKPGIYVDIVSGEPLFSSLDKYDSGTGWPSFTKPLEIFTIVHKDLDKLKIGFTEVRSRYANSHLGHVFKEKTPTGLRYCINSAALRFIPSDDLDKYGYSVYNGLFNDN